MGLDMYLTRKHYVQNWDHMGEEEKHHITILKGEQPAPIDVERISYVITQELYWRKANQIHQWFVENVQDGNDDCGEYYVSREKLEELLNTVTRVLEASKLVPAKIENGRQTVRGENGELFWKPIIEDGECVEDPTVARELLPTTEGFFFGSTDYDQYYYDDLKRTKDELERILAEPRGSFYYHSSW